MNQEAIAEELERLRQKLEELDPASQEYSTIVKNYHELMKCLHEDLAACDADLDHQLKRKLDKANQELKEKEAADRVRMSRTEALCGLGKVGLMIVGTLGSIILTGSFESTQILSSKCLSWIRGLTPRI